MADSRPDQVYQTTVGISQISGKINLTQVSYLGITALWVVGVLLYILFLRKELTRRRKEEDDETQKRKRHRGKRCPQCRNIISSHRMTCQHCGNQFSETEIKDSPESEGKEHHHSRHGHGSSGRRRKKKRGKKCPQCNNIINFYREVCQHCGHKFDVEPQPGQGPEGPENKDAAN